TGESSSAVGVRRVALLPAARAPGPPARVLLCVCEYALPAPAPQIPFTSPNQTITMKVTRRSPLSMCATHDADVQVIDRSLRSCLATSTWLSPARRRAAAIAAPSSAEISRFDMRASGQLRPERKFNVVFPSQAYPNTAQSCGNELAAPGLMSFQKVKLPSAPSLYSSTPPFAGLRALNHSALLNVDSGVESRSSASVLTGIGFKPLPMSVHFVTLPSFPNLNSCKPCAVVTPS